MFSVRVGLLYRPNESKVRNVKTKDYLGKARLVAASDQRDAFTGFTGAEIKKVRSALPPLPRASTGYPDNPTARNISTHRRGRSRPRRDLVRGYKPHQNGSPQQNRYRATRPHASAGA